METAVVARWREIGCLLKPPTPVAYVALLHLRSSAASRRQPRALGWYCTNGAGDCERNPFATSELESTITYGLLRAPASEMVELAAVWSTKCSVVIALISAARCSCVSM